MALRFRGLGSAWARSAVTYHLEARVGAVGKHLSEGSPVSRPRPTSRLRPCRHRRLSSVQSSRLSVSISAGPRGLVQEAPPRSPRCCCDVHSLLRKYTKGLHAFCVKGSPRASSPKESSRGGTSRPWNPTGKPWVVLGDCFLMSEANWWFITRLLFCGDKAAHPVTVTVLTMVLSLRLSASTPVSR